MTNIEIRRIENLLFSWLPVAKDPDSIRDVLVALPLPDRAEDEYYEALEREHRRSFDYMTPKEEIVAFDAKDTVVGLIQSAKKRNDKPELERLLPYRWALGGKPEPIRLPNYMITRAKEHPIANVFAKRGIIVKGGFCKCPFHPEDTASCKVYKNNTFYCFGCQAHGDTITLVSRLQGLNFVEAIKYLQ